MISAVCVGVMYSCEYNVCEVTVSVHPHQWMHDFRRPRWESNPQPLGY